MLALLVTGCGSSPVAVRAGLLGNFAFRGAREHDWTSQTLVRDASELTGFELLDEYQQSSSIYPREKVPPSRDGLQG